MGTIEIKKIERKVTIGKKGEQRQQVQKTYGKIIYRGTLGLADMAEHIMKHGSVYTEDVVIGVITKLKTCMQEMLADGYKVKLDGIGTLYPVLSSKGVDNAKDFSANEAITRLGISFLADQSKKSVYKASAMRQDTKLRTSGSETSPQTTSPQPSPSGEGASQTGGENDNQGNENQGGGGTTNPPSGGGNEND